MGWTYTPDPTLEQLITDIAHRYPVQRVEGLSGFREALRLAGDPHLVAMPPVFHIAGTNGKGSTLAILQAMMEGAGKVVHKFTSPHLIRFEERIVVSGSPVTPNMLCRAIHDLDADLDDGAVSFFEFFTLVAFRLFAAHPADAVLLETGLGGLQDSTNVIDRPAAVLLTRISLDHRHILGDTIAEIAAQKAGIIKEGVPVIVAPHQDPAAMAVFRAAAAAANAPLIEAEIDTALPAPEKLPGAHQKENAATAVAALKAAGFDGDILSGLKNATWPGRLQRLDAGHLVDMLPSGAEMWVDGAHNDSGVEVLCAHAAAHWNDRPLHILFAMKSGKEAADILPPLRKLADRMISVAMPDHPLMAPADSYGLPVAENLTAALRMLADANGARILVAGSLYLVGQVLRENEYV